MCVSLLEWKFRRATFTAIFPFTFMRYFQLTSDRNIFVRNLRKDHHLHHEVKRE